MLRSLPRDVVRIAKSGLAQGLLSTFGRRNVARLGRFLSNEARLDVGNDMSSNGELLVQRAVLTNLRGTAPATVFDVGANLGDWSDHLLQLAGSLQVPVALHAFEPAPTTRESLRRRLGDRATVVGAAASDSDGEATLHLVHATAGVNSLLARGDGVDTTAVRVPTVRLDAYCRNGGISQVNLVKCDTEGHDFSVLEGLRGMLTEKAVDVIQFEYNWRWIDARRFLRDVFALAESTHYQVGKVTPRGVELYRAWDPELESYREANYLLIAPRALGWFQTFDWWNDHQL